MIPEGFIFSTVEAAIKKPGRKDLALIYSEVEAGIAGTFTTNKVKAAPVKLDIKKIRSGKGQAIVINSGNANACTGKKGVEDALEITILVADSLNIKPSLVYVCSTGVIGTLMPMDRIRPKISELADNLGRATIEDDAVKKSFNRITIDGDRSTNDTALIIANGMLGNPQITEKSGTYPAFKKVLHEVTFELSKLIVKDGEGATKFIEIEVKGARNEADAEKAAFAVANSNLVKTAIYGNDANWGRIMAALGYSGVAIKEEKIDIYFGKLRMANKGLTTGKDKEANEVLRGKDIKIIIDLHLGRSSAKD